MNNIEKFLNKIEQSEGFSEKLKKHFFSTIYEGFEAVNEDMKEIESQFAKKIVSVKEQLNELENNLNVLRDDFESVCVNVRNTNRITETLKSDTELFKVKLQGIRREIDKFSTSDKQHDSFEQTRNNHTVTTQKTSESESKYDSIDYFDFENHFRGSMESIKNAQKIYLPFFKDKKNILDIGCGRGEFLSLMKENDIPAKGIDIYEPYVDYCKMNGFDAVCGDGIQYLSESDMLDGIFVGQVVEHLELNSIINLCNHAYEKLTDGGCIVIETPNPTSLAIYTNAFYIDPSHIKPVHPLTMRYFLEKAGFRKIEIIYTENSLPQESIPALKISNSENTEEFNIAMKKVSDMLFGSQDYAIIAIK